MENCQTKIARVNGTLEIPPILGMGEGQFFFACNIIFGVRMCEIFSAMIKLQDIFFLE